MVEVKNDSNNGGLVNDEEITLPKFAGINSQIPPEWMPNDDQAMRYFQYFFEHIHPYVPVVNPPLFYQKWASDRASISPLVLEGIFACSSLAMQQMDVGNRWLALALSKHGIGATFIIGY